MSFIFLILVMGEKQIKQRGTRGCLTLPAMLCTLGIGNYVLRFDQHIIYKDPSKPLDFIMPAGFDISDFVLRLAY